MKELRETKEEILLHNALDWKKFKILVAVCCSYVVIIGIKTLVDCRIN